MYPFGLLAVPPEKIDPCTGNIRNDREKTDPGPLITEKDVDCMGRVCCQRSLQWQDVNAADRIHILLRGYGLFTGGLGAVTSEPESVRNGNPDVLQVIQREQRMCMEDFGAHSIIACTPSYAPTLSW